MNKPNQDSARAWDSLAKCYREDADFRDRLAADPAAAMAETGLELPAGIGRVSVVENTADTFHVVFPPSLNAALGDEALGGVAGGTGYWSDSQLAYLGPRYTSCH